MSPDGSPRDNGFSIEVGSGVSRREVVTRLAAAGAVTGLAGCLSDATGGTPEPTDASSRPADFEFARHPAWAPPGWEPAHTETGDGRTQRRCVFVIHDIQNPLFVPLTCGFHDALSRFGWTGKVRGPSVGGMGWEIGILKNEIDAMEPGDVIVTNSYDKHVTDSYDPDDDPAVNSEQPYIDVVQSALDNDIIVINANTISTTSDWNSEPQRETFTYQSPVTDEDREMIIPHVGIRNERGGVAMAREMHDRLESQFPEQEEYTVFLVNDLPDNPQVTRRIDKTAVEEGTAQRYFKTQNDVTIYQDQVFEPPYPPEIEETRSFVVDTIQGEDVDAVVGSALWAAVGTGNAREAGDLPEELLVCGFDLTGMIEPLREGRVDFVVDGDPYSQGFLPVSLAWMYVERGIEMKDLEWGVSVWDEQNTEFATQRRSWEELMDWQNENYDFLQ